MNFPEIKSNNSFPLEYRIKYGVCLSREEFEPIVLEKVPDAEFVYALEGLSVDTRSTSLNDKQLTDIFSEFFGYPVSSIHIDDCEDVGIWVIFKKGDLSWQ